MPPALTLLAISQQQRYQLFTALLSRIEDVEVMSGLLMGRDTGYDDDPTLPGGIGPASVHIVGHATYESITSLTAAV